MTMRWPKTESPKTQPCCGRAHGLPFQHTRFYQDKRGRTKHAYECAICFRGRHIDGRAIRWAEPRSPHCAECSEEIRRFIGLAADAPGAEDGDPFALVQHNLDPLFRGPR